MLFILLTLIFCLVIQYYLIVEILLFPERYDLETKTNEIYNYIKEKCTTPILGLYHLIILFSNNNNNN